MDTRQRLNCWEIKQCGREAGGQNVATLGVCPVSLASDYSGVNGGDNAGRVCWAVAGTLCGGKVQGIFAQKLANCYLCEFFQQVRDEEQVGDAHLLLQGMRIRR
jgi:hypothetical protein